MKGSGPKTQLIQPDLFEVNKGPKPLIIPRSEHCLSRKDVDREALKVLYRLKDNGYIAYLVGGGVRDILIGKRPKDFDIGTNATPEEIKKLFPYSRIIGRRFRLVHVYFKGGKAIEVSTFRRMAEYDATQSQNGEDEGDNIFGTPQEDALRRDLTINGLFYNIADFSIIDYVGGMADLKAGIIRTIGDPEVRFLKDPVRMLRAIRHAARTGFTIEKNTWNAILMHKDMIHLCAIPRVRDEWLKDLRSGASQKWIELMFESGLFASTFPGYFMKIENDDDINTAKGLISGLLSRLDIMVNSGSKLEESFMLALLIYPRLHVMPEWNSLYSERLRWPTQETRNLLNEAIAPYDFKKSVRDEAAQILAGLWPLKRCIEIGNWPKRIWSKQRFRDIVTIYDMIQEQLGLNGIGPDPHLNPQYRRETSLRVKRHRRKTKKEREPKTV